MPVTSLRRPSAPIRAPAFNGGLLVVSGPPLEGKSPLAAAIAERLPDAVLVGGADDLGSERVTERAVLDSAVRAWRARRSPATTIVAVARFPTRASRREASRCARDERMAFLLVECTSSTIRSLRQVSRLFLPPQEALARMDRYEAARRSYVEVDDAERRALPALCLRRALSDLDGAATRAAIAWARR